MARDLVDQLITNGKVTRGFLGVNIGDLDDTMAEYYGLDEPHGAIVNRVNEGSPADRAGLEQGDVIIAVNGTPIERVSDLQIKIASLKPGTDVALEIVREGARKTLTAQLVELADEEELGSAPKPPSESDDFLSRLGFEATELTQSHRREYGLPADVDGIVVTKVRALGPAGKANLREGDVILQVNHEPVTSVRQLRSTLETVPGGDPALFLIQRGEVELHLALRMPD
jgi:S1-C subfamily serine protease